MKLTYYRAKPPSPTAGSEVGHPCSPETRCVYNSLTKLMETERESRESAGFELELGWARVADRETDRVVANTVLSVKDKANAVYTRRKTRRTM